MVIPARFPARGASKEPKAIAPRFSEPRDSIRSATLLTLIIAVLMVVFGFLWGGRDPLLIASIIGGVMIATCWAVTLLIASTMLIIRRVRAWDGRATPAKSRPPDARGGVSDEWLDSPF